MDRIDPIEVVDLIDRAAGESEISNFKFQNRLSELGKTSAWGSNSVSAVPLEPGLISMKTQAVCRNVLCALLLIWAGHSTLAQTASPHQAEIESYALKIMQDWKVPGLSVAVVHGGQTVLAKGFGVRELAVEGAVDEHTLFAIASNSKAFTTACLAILVDEGKLAWDDPAAKYLPELRLSDPLASQALTVRDLVCHRCGLETFSGDLLWYESHYSADEILHRLRYLKPKHGFRAKYGYQNLMFIAAARIVEKLSGQTWGAFVRQRILEPLKMTRTTTSITEARDNVASPHNESGGSMRALPQGNVDNALGACGLNASASELASWLRLQLGDGEFEGQRIFSANLAWTMTQAHMAIPVSRGESLRIPSRHFNSYGLGWFLHDYQGRKVVSHSGGLDGMISQSAFLPEAGLGIVVLTNSESPASQILRDRIIDLYLNVEPKRDWNAEALERKAKADLAEAGANQKVEAARVSGTSPTLPLTGYAGTYHAEMYGDVQITVEAGQLVLRMMPAPAFVADLEPWHYNTFRLKWRPTVKYNFPRGFVTFSINGEGKTDRLEIDQPNNDFWFYELDLRRKE